LYISVDLSVLEELIGKSVAEMKRLPQRAV
jgi:hypothetical protein